jgi:hypothetical protein
MLYYPKEEGERIYEGPKYPLFKQKEGEAIYYYVDRMWVELCHRSNSREEMLNKEPENSQIFWETVFKLLEKNLELVTPGSYQYIICADDKSGNFEFGPYGHKFMKLLEGIPSDVYKDIKRLEEYSNSKRIRNRPLMDQLLSCLAGIINEMIEAEKRA